MVEGGNRFPGVHATPHTLNQSITLKMSEPPIPMMKFVLHTEWFCVPTHFVKFLFSPHGLGIVTHTCNPSTQKAETEGLT